MESKYMINSNGSSGMASVFPMKRKIEPMKEQNSIKKPNYFPPKQQQQQHQYGKNVMKKNTIEQDRKALPVYNCRQRILKEVEANDTLLIMGETGSGKTTQIPQFLLQAGYATNGIIGITQPRRVAAITIAKRVAQELSCNVGDTVGYTVRFEDTTTERTRIRYLTDGILLREAIRDRLLRRYSAIMLDEAHERTVNADVLFGIVKEAQQERRKHKMAKLKLIITSATMDIDHFGQYFKVKGMYLEGRTHPVRVMHAKESQDDYIHAALVTLFDIHRHEPINHDVLIFLTGQEEIEALAQQIRQLARINNSGPSDVRVFTLYAQLAQGKQLECFLPVPANTRKIVLATNIAETSITIPGIRCVIDCGYVKEKSFNPSTGLDTLKTVRISQAQAWQRSGRAGRDAPGKCYRTYTKSNMEKFRSAAQPEILRANLTSTVLQLLALGIDCASFDFIDPPHPEGVQSAYKALEQLGAVKAAATPPAITSTGRLMAQFPLDPRFAKLLLAAPSFGCMEEMLSLVAALSSDNVFIGHTDKSELAALAHAKFQSKHGDHLTLLNVFATFQKTDKPKVWCHDNFLNIRNLNYARNVRNQLVEICNRIGLASNSCGDNLDAVKKCLLTGLFDNMATLQKEGHYLTLSGRVKAKIHPSSVLHGKYKPQCILFSEMVQTEHNFLRQVTEISVEWIEEVLPNMKFNIK
ncbi:ATP-dependent RNA helicase DHX33 [Drosophila albomicans]|uniref:RNA helicase n=1 Tax=Drosophila albomicans TaxID=7291 RepID=A0A6P8W2K0_DROAB|nr:ATP-dependent RNA helicase DHX33 [Drosophila albomicans]XP_051858349.1 ATP-dependent RNA helicase DHX33 [Drosophila albomicans]